MVIFDPFKLHPSKPYHLDCSGLDRDDVSRKSPQLLGRLLSIQKQSLYQFGAPKIFFCKHGKPLSAMRVLNSKNVSKFIDGSEIVTMGRNRNQEAYLCLDLSQFELMMLDPLNDYGVFGDLREADNSIGGDDGSIMGYARAMCHWHQKNKHCSSCGGRTVSANSGHSRNCMRNDCGTTFFPALIQLS